LLKLQICFFFKKKKSITFGQPPIFVINSFVCLFFYMKLLSSRRAPGRMKLPIEPPEPERCLGRAMSAVDHDPRWDPLWLDVATGRRCDVPEVVRVTGDAAVAAGIVAAAQSAATMWKRRTQRRAPAMSSTRDDPEARLQQDWEKLPPRTISGGGDHTGSGGNGGSGGSGDGGADLAERAEPPSVWAEMGEAGFDVLLPALRGVALRPGLEAREAARCAALVASTVGTAPDVLLRTVREPVCIDAALRRGARRGEGGDWSSADGSRGGAARAGILHWGPDLCVVGTDKPMEPMSKPAAVAEEPAELDGPLLLAASSVCDTLAPVFARRHTRRTSARGRYDHMHAVRRAAADSAYPRGARSRFAFAVHTSNSNNKDRNSIGDSNRNSNKIDSNKIDKNKDTSSARPHRSLAPLRGLAPAQLTAFHAAMADADHPGYVPGIPRLPVRAVVGVLQCDSGAAAREACIIRRALSDHARASVVVPAQPPVPHVARFGTLVPLSQGGDWGTALAVLRGGNTPQGGGGA
jgi:hypothetical protein